MDSDTPQYCCPFFYYFFNIVPSTGNFGEVILRSLRAVSRYARKTPFEKIYWGDAVLTEKSKIFLSKQRHPSKSSPSHAFFAQRKTVRKPRKMTSPKLPASMVREEFLGQNGSFAAK